MYQGMPKLNYSLVDQPRITIDVCPAPDLVFPDLSTWSSPRTSSGANWWSYIVSSAMNCESPGAVGKEIDQLTILNVRRLFKCWNLDERKTILDNIFIGNAYSGLQTLLRVNKFLTLVKSDTSRNWDRKAYPFDNKLEWNAVCPW